ncbi:hypothetical protein PCE1_004542 [Barthelona sp. PCE]
MLSEHIKELAQEWLRLDFNPVTRAEIEKLVEEQNEEELTKRLVNRIKFGTAGLRGRMQAGFSAMNTLIVCQASQGLAKYLEAKIPDFRDRGIVIGYDKRYNSLDFALTTASVFIGLGAKVYMYGDFVPTPLVPFAIKHTGAACGVMVTASHNPKDDNGYKLYWENAAQIITPHDSGIHNSILENLEIWDTNVPLEKVWENPLVISEDDDFIEAYLAAEKTALCTRYEANKKSKVKCVYTAMHGVGYFMVDKIRSVFGFPRRNFYPVESQQHPDPEFPTVPFPNPEEGEGTLELSFDEADRVGANLIIASDPDCDRMLFVERQPDGKWFVFSGNQIANILAWWMLRSYKEQGKDVSKVAMVTTNVSSEFLKSMGEAEGFDFHATLTGFKWMANKAEELKVEGKEVLLCYEQAIGFAAGDVVFDKDGVSAYAVAMELATYLDEQNMSIHDQLTALYEKYGFFCSNDGYYFTPGNTVTDAVVDYIRHGNNGTYLDNVNGVKVAHVSDLMTPGYDNTTPDNKPTLPVSAAPNMTFWFENDIRVTIRTSGTEPKVKWYSEIRRPTLEAARTELDEFIDILKRDWLKPEHFGLISKE